MAATLRKGRRRLEKARGIMRKRLGVQTMSNDINQETLRGWVVVCFVLPKSILDTGSRIRQAMSVVVTISCFRIDRISLRKALF